MGRRKTSRSRRACSLTLSLMLITAGAAALPGALALAPSLLPPPSAVSPSNPLPDGLSDVSTSAPDTASGSLPPGVTESWLETIQEQIRMDEYKASLQELDQSGNPISPRWHFVNRAQNLRAYFDREGWELRPRTSDNLGDWVWTYRLRSVGRLGAERRELPTPAFPELENGRIVFTHPGVAEWYANSERGIKQGFDITTRPGGEGLLVLEGLVSGGLKVWAATEDRIVFSTDSRDVLEYGELLVTDSSGRELRARLEYREPFLNILIEDLNANYPIHVDPLASSPNWTAESDQAYAYFGWSVSTAGDVNGDGFSDVIVGAYGWDGGQTDEGGRGFSTAFPPTRPPQTHPSA